MSDDSYLQALQEERRGYVMHGNKDRVAAVDAEIARVRRAAGQPVDEPPQSPEPKPARTTTRKG